MERILKERRILNDKRNIAILLSKFERTGKHKVTRIINRGAEN